MHENMLKGYEDWVRKANAVMTMIFSVHNSCWRQIPCTNVHD